jgi:hypothetical protein
MRTSWRAGTPFDTTVAGDPAADAGELVAASGMGADTTDAMDFGDSSKIENLLTLN